MSGTIAFHKKNAPPQPDAETQARFIADEQGVIAHASPAFNALLGLNASGQPLNTLLRFAEADEVFHPGGLFGKGAFIDSIREGVHGVSIPAHRDQVFSVRFDRVRLANGRRYLVGAFDSAEDSSPVVEEISALVQPRMAEVTPVSDLKISVRAEDNELKHFLDMSNDMMAVSGRDGLFLRVNSAFGERLGYSDAELASLRFTDLVHAEDRSWIRSCQNSLMHEGGPGNVIDFEARILTKSGGMCWVEWRQKRSGDYVYSVGHDVTDIKIQEAALKTQARQLSEAQSIGHMGHWRWTVGRDEIEFSDEIYRIFGVDPESFGPTLDSVNAMLHRRDIGRLMQAFQRAMIERNNYDMEFRVLRPNGEVRNIRCEGRCELDHEGDVIALFGIMQDVTERTLYEKQLRLAKDAAERAYAAKSQFLANMSHELRTPLNAIIGFSEMMQRQLLGPLGTPRYLDYITGIRESGEHLLDLISDILDMSKIEAGKYELDLEELNASKVIRLAVHMINGRAQDAGIQLLVEIEDDTLQIVADRRAVMQILLNLLSNAVKFTNPGGTVRVSCLQRPDHFVIKVQDTGIGIPANKLGVITRPFEQAASHYTREHEGTGLGLAITKELTEMHGGGLFIESTVGIGTTVTVRLPYNAYDQIKVKRAKG